MEYNLPNNKTVNLNLSGKKDNFLIIEIGTNSIKSLYKTYKFETDKVYITKLGKGLVKNNLLDDSSMTYTIEIIKKIINEHKNHTTDVRIIATEVLRIASNKDTFIKLLESEIRYSIKILSEEDEAKCSFLSVNNNSAIVLDIGGGSTEISFINNNSFNYKSFPIGVLSKFNKKKLEEIFILQDIFQQINNNKKLVGIGGTLTTLGMIIEKTNDIKKIDFENFTVNKKTIFHLLSLIKSCPADKRAEEFTGLTNKRADTISPGREILNFIREVLKCNEIQISCKGVRHGYIIL
jgi:exopolyphosphatase/guanosine-5'-triphosphate,3'-diphosphate pyrophosphatase